MSASLIVISYLADNVDLEHAVNALPSNMRVACSPRCFRGTMIRSMVDPRSQSVTSVVDAVGVTKPSAAYVLSFNTRADCVAWCDQNRAALVGVWTLMIENDDEIASAP